MIKTKITFTIIRRCLTTQHHLGWMLVFVLTSTLLQAQLVRTDVSLDDNWFTVANDSNRNAFSGFEQSYFNQRAWKRVSVPHNWDDYEGYRRKLHGNRHGFAWYRKTFSIAEQPRNKRFFLFFEGVGSYATVWLNGQQVGYHAGGRTTFTLDITNAVLFGKPNLLAVRADHPAGIRDLPWVCGGCSDERGFSEGSQPMGIFRPVHLIVTNDVRIEPFGVHIWNDSNVSEQSAVLNYQTEIRNYTNHPRRIKLVNRLVNAAGETVNVTEHHPDLPAKGTIAFSQSSDVLKNLKLWSAEDPYLYSLVTELYENDRLLDRITSPYGIRYIKWPGRTSSSKQFLLNGKPVFINGIAEYEHLMGNSHAFSAAQIRSRVMQMKSAGFNFFREGHHPHNLRYQDYWDSLGILSWTQMGAHIWFDSPAFRKNFKALLTEWVRERRNSPSIVLWGLQNESKLPEDFARECTELIRSLDPTASSQRLVTTCNGGSGTDWDVPQNWTGTYGGNPATYDEDLKRQVLVGEYGAWRRLDLHTEGPFVQNGPYSEDRMTQLMELKVRLAESVKDSVAGHIMWLFTSHDNPGRVQGGEGFRELDRIGPVNYKGLLTPWEEPLDVYYMYRANYARADKEPMVYIVSHTWPDRWTSPGKKSGIVVYSNCDEVELFNDVNAVSLGRKKRGGTGTHFQWDEVNIQYNLLYAVGYVNGKEVARDRIVLHHLPQSPGFDKLYQNARNITLPQPGYNYLYRVNCGGPEYQDRNSAVWMADRKRSGKSSWGSSSWTNDFKGMPPYFASQRVISAPVDGTTDWKLFQSIRYGREKLRYDFPVTGGEYLVELYFIEPWLGAGGGVDATGWRLFDVAVNDRVVLKDLDIWKEAGYSSALKKTVKVKVTGGTLTVSFPNVSAGQAVISAIAIARTSNQSVKAAPSPQPLIAVESAGQRAAGKMEDWLSAGDQTYLDEATAFSSLPPELFGSQWWKTTSENSGQFKIVVKENADVYVAVDTTTAKSGLPSQFTSTSSQLSLSNGRSFAVYKARMKKGATTVLNSNTQILIMAVPAATIEPAYDLKSVTSYKAVEANIQGEGIRKGKVDGKDRVVFESASPGNRIEWSITTGVADIYSLTISYNNPQQQTLKGKLQFITADGVMMKEQTVEFTPTRPGKSNYITTNTGSMINAGHYKVRLSSTAAGGLSVNTLDVQ